MEDLIRAVTKLLSSTNPEEVSIGLDKVRARMPRASDDEKRRYVEMVSALFYIDTLDHPEYLAVVEDAVSLVANAGRSAIPILIQQLGGGDVKSQMAIGQALGHMGAESVPALLRSITIPARSRVPPSYCMRWARSNRRRLSARCPHSKAADDESGAARQRNPRARQVRGIDPGR